MVQRRVGAGNGVMTSHPVTRLACQARKASCSCIDKGYGMVSRSAVHMHALTLG